MRRYLSAAARIARPAASSGNRSATRPAAVPSSNHSRNWSGFGNSPEPAPSASNSGGSGTFARPTRRVARASRRSTESPTVVCASSSTLSAESAEPPTLSRARATYTAAAFGCFGFLANQSRSSLTPSAAWPR